MHAAFALPFRLFPIKLPSGFDASGIRSQRFLQVAASAFAQEVGVVSWRENRDGFSGAAEEVAEVMGLEEVHVLALGVGKIERMTHHLLEDVCS